jgi:hypothetical protein
MAYEKYALSVSALQEFIQRHPLDTNKHSRQILVDLGDLFRCHIKLSTLVLAALFSGYAVVPADNGRVFRFIKL